MQAQNYKSLTDAVESVRAAVDTYEHQALGSKKSVPNSAVSTKSASGPSADAADVSTKISYFQTFIKLAKSTNGGREPVGVAQGLQLLDQLYNVQTLPEPRKSRIAAARAELLTFITL